MTQTQGDLAALSRFVFRAPDWSASLLVALLVAAVAGVAAFDSQFVLDDAYQGMVYIGVPAVIAAFATPWVDRRVGGRLTYNRSALLALVCEVLQVVILVGAAAIATLTALGQTFVFDAFVAGLASIYALRLFVVVAVSRRSLLVASIPASIQTAVAAALVFVYGGTVQYLEVGGPLVEAYLSRTEHAPAVLGSVQPQGFALLVALCGVYALGVYLFLVTIDRPWRRSLGVSVLDFIGGFVGHIAEDSRELEDFFEQVGEEAVVPVTVLAIRRPDGTEKARFVLPMVHPGPMGEIGGGDLPRRVARRAEGLAFPPHATAGHDFNLVTEREVDEVLAAADRALERVAYGDRATRSHRERAGDAKLLGQAVGDDALVVATHAPRCADDVDFSVGLSASAEARVSGLRTVMLVDAHNCNDGLEGGMGHVTPGSKRSFDLLTAAGRLGEQLAAASRHPLRVGVAWDPTDWEPADGIGPLGVRVAVFEVDGQRTAYVLIDGNNMEPGLREEILAALTGGDPAATTEGPHASETHAVEDADATAAASDATDPTATDGAGARVDEAEVMTTDTHVVNTVTAANQVGPAIDHDELVALVEDLVVAATADLEPVEAGMAQDRAEVTVFGNDRTETLASTANAMVQMGGALLLVVVGAAMAVSLLIFLLAS